MAVRFDIDKYNKIKEEYIKFLQGGIPDGKLKHDFDTYQTYFDSDTDVKQAIQEKKRKDALIKKQVSASQIHTSDASPRQAFYKGTKAQRNGKRTNEEDLPTSRNKTTRSHSHTNTRTIDRRNSAGHRETILNLKNSHDLLSMVNSSVFGTLKIDDLKFLQSRVMVLCDDEEKSKITKMIDERIQAISNKSTPKPTGYTPMTKIIFTPMGGQNGRTHH